jgi:hypothetical protein
VGQRRDCMSWEVHFFLWQRAGKSSIGNRSFVHKRKVSAIKRVEFRYDVIHSAERPLV